MAKYVVVLFSGCDNEKIDSYHNTYGEALQALNSHCPHMYPDIMRIMSNGRLTSEV